jgi:hypothetical protein
MVAVYEVNPEQTLEDEVAPLLGAQCTAELAECTCPEFCERDHDTD